MSADEGELFINDNGPLALFGDQVGGDGATVTTTRVPAMLPTSMNVPAGAAAGTLFTGGPDEGPYSKPSLLPSLEHQDIPKLVRVVAPPRKVFDPGSANWSRIEKPLVF